MRNLYDWTADRRTRYCPECESDTSHLKTCSRYVKMELYDADYFLRGRETGKSLYENYHWMPELTVPMVCAMVSHLGITPDDSVLDFGCARGYVVKALRQEGYCAYGFDVSEWATKNAHPDISNYITRSPEVAFRQRYDWVIVKDVLEHVDDLFKTVDTLMGVAHKGLFAVVPLAHGDRYDVADYELDSTHIHRNPLKWWVGQFHRPGWATTGQYRVRGVKDNYAQYPTGNGFITARRIGD